MIVFLIIILVAGITGYAFIGVKNPQVRGNRGPRRGGAATPAISMSRSEVATRWQVIMAASAAGPAGLKSAISDADKLVDGVLRSHGIAGDTMGERLKQARDRFNDRDIYDGLWRAHKLRNALAHEVGFDLVPSQAKEALHDFERALKTLGAL